MRRFIFIVLLAVLLVGIVSAEELEVKKTLRDDEIHVGDEVIIQLEFTNPFNQEIPIRIEDKSIFAGNGLDIQCLEKTLPAERSVTLEYEPIVAYAAGNYTLDSARVTYTNPETGREEEINSNELEIKIKEKAIQNLQQSGITTIYQCGGTNMRSTSYSSSSSSQQQQQSLQQRVNQMQQKNQDMNSLRQQLQQQMQEQRELEQGMQEMIENNENFQEMQKELQEKGYELRNKEINPESNETGEFTYTYSKDDETAQIQGRMEEGEMRDLEKHTSEELRELQEKLEDSQEFQRMQKILQEEDYNFKAGNLTPIQNNVSEFNYQYLNSKNQSANITGEIQSDGNITEMKIVRKGKGNDRINPVWLLLLLVVLIILYFVMKRLKGKDLPIETPPEEEKPVDFRKLALDMIKEAKRMYAKGDKKKAYTKVSEAVRLYFRYVLKQKEELTDYEVVQLLKRENHKKLGTTKECLDLCNLVKFAKYKPKDEDFNRIVELAYEIIR